MSNKSNDILMERANEQLEYWTGTLWERLIQRDIDTQDLEALAYHVTQAEREQAIQEDSTILEADYEIAMNLRKEMREDGYLE